mmetsp:Transcript_12303/g.41017  ORF Transcript_12303/g.41017 Transcript_12303/m.41017 type:complete len:264 (-) Transcript_12303:321-1112(-)
MTIAFVERDHLLEVNHCTIGTTVQASVSPTSKTIAPTYLGLSVKARLPARATRSRGAEKAAQMASYSAGSKHPVNAASQRRTSSQSGAALESETRARLRRAKLETWWARCDVTSQSVNDGKAFFRTASFAAAAGATSACCGASPAPFDPFDRHLNDDFTGTGAPMDVTVTFFSRSARNPRSKRIARLYAAGSAGSRGCAETFAPARPVCAGPASCRVRFEGGSIGISILDIAASVSPALRSRGASSSVETLSAPGSLSLPIIA